MDRATIESSITIGGWIFCNPDGTVEHIPIDDCKPSNNIDEWEWRVVDYDEFMEIVHSHE